MPSVKTWDVIIVGSGIIGLSLSIALRKRGAKVLVVERGEPGREASHAAAGMLADHGDEFPSALLPLATASTRMYPEFVHELQDESGINVDLRDDGTILLHAEGAGVSDALAVPLSQLEAALVISGRPVSYLKERSVDPRALGSAAWKAARHREVDISSGTAVAEILVANGRVDGVRTDKTSYHAAVVVNCAGAWAGQFSPVTVPTRPVKGQIFSVIGAAVIRHVVRAPEVYLVPRSDGRIVIGATLEEAGFDKRTDAETIQRLHQAAIRLVPALAQGRLHEAWAGLRPGTPDHLPILGETSIAGYFAATGHYRDGILLAPVTASLMAGLIIDGRTDYDLAAFSSERFIENQKRSA
jgi:glycine/D-amino acid oxidase-like deaminating enzyme